MDFFRLFGSLASTIFVSLTISGFSAAQGQEPLRVAYGGFNETAAPMWVGIDKGIFKKYGIGASMIQVRNGALSVATLVSKDVQAFWPSPATVLSGASGGLRISCIASPTNKIPRNLIVRKEIKTLEDLRGRIVGVQSIGGGFWLQTMIVLDHLGVDAEKYRLNMRVIGDAPIIAQALLAGNIDVAFLTYSLSEAPLKAGFRSLADAADLKAPYQGPGICALKDSIASSPDLFMRLTKGMAEATAFILDSNNKPEVMKVLQKHLRLQKAEDAEASYRVLRLMATLDIAPNPAAWKAVQRIVSRVSPRIAQLDIDQIIDGSFVRNLEASGFLAEERKKLR